MEMFISHLFYKVPSELVTLCLDQLRWHPGDCGRQWNSKGVLLETLCFPMVFEEGPRGIAWGRQDPLHAGDGLAQGHTAKSFIFALFYKGPSELVRFWLS